MDEALQIGRRKSSVLQSRLPSTLNHDADQLAIDSVAEELKADQVVQQHASVNPHDNFALALKGKIEGAFADRMDKNADIAARFLNDADFRAVLTDYLVKKVHSDLTVGGAGAGSGAP